MEKNVAKHEAKRITALLVKMPGIILSLRQNPVFNYAMLGLLALIIGVLSLLLGATVFGVPMFRSYFASFMVILLNLLPPVLLIFLLYFICGRAWIAFTFPSLLILLISMIHFFKVQLRGDPLVVSDYAYIFEAGTVMSEYSLTMNWKIFLAAVIFICGVVFSVTMLKYKLTGSLFRVIASASVIIVSAVLYIFVYTDAGLYSRTSGDTKTADWTPNLNYIAKGFMYPLIHSIRHTLADMRGQYPDWYDEKAAKEAFDALVDADIPDDKKVNIIVIMLEAYADLSLFDALDFTRDVYGPLHRLQAETVSGTLVANVFAGGTIDTERLFLTGNTQLTSFTSSTNSYVHYLRNQGYYTEGMHTGDMWFYDRRPVNTHLGFHKYVFLDDFEDGNRTDSFFFPTVLDMYKSRDLSNPYFSFNLSYQNHGAYYSSWTQEPYVIAQNDLSDESFNILNNYLSGIYDTGQRIESFLDSLLSDPDPVVILFFGDHMPWLGNMQSVYTELGINIDRSTEEGLLNYYSTPYIIWANDAAKHVLDNPFSGDGGSFSPGFLMGELFTQCSWVGEGYMQALRELQTSIDVINTPTGFFRENGALTLQLSPKGETAFRNLRMIELYRLSHFRS